MISTPLPIAFVAKPLDFEYFLACGLQGNLFSRLFHYLLAVEDLRRHRVYLLRVLLEIARVLSTGAILGG